MSEKNNDQTQDDMGRGQESPSGQMTSTEAPRHGSGVPVGFILGLLVTIGAVLFIILDSSEEVVYAYTVDQVVDMKSELVNKNFRVSGKVHAGSIQKKPGTLDIRFQINHNDKLITVAYDKALPDTFAAGVDVVAEGKLNESDVLIADNVIAKCPSKYEEGAPTAKGGAQHPSNIPKGGAKHPSNIPKN